MGADAGPSQAAGRVRRRDTCPPLSPLCPLCRGHPPLSRRPTTAPEARHLWIATNPEHVPRRSHRRSHCLSFRHSYRQATASATASATAPSRRRPLIRSNCCRAPALSAKSQRRAGLPPSGSADRRGRVTGHGDRRGGSGQI